METAHDAAGIGQLFIDAVDIGIAGIGIEPHAAEPFAADKVQFKGIDDEAYDFPGRNLEQFRRQGHFRHQRQIGGLDALVGQIHGKRRLGRTGYADDDDIGLQKADRILAVIVLDGELDGFDPFEIFFIQAVDHAGLHSRFRRRNLADAIHHWADDIDDGHIGIRRQRLQLAPQDR